jgi:cell division protein ZapA (FtsZ GTPase activity inhibitor)
MAERARVDVTLLGQPLTIRTEASPEYVKTLATFIEERVATLRKSGVHDTMMALTLAALDIADELFRARQDRASADETLQARIEGLTSLLDGALPAEERGRGGA